MCAQKSITSCGFSSITLGAKRLIIEAHITSLRIKKGLGMGYSLEGKNAAVTGAASGIGWASSKALLEAQEEQRWH